MRKILKRLINKPKWINLRSVTPISRVFGLDRGTPIDRFYIEQFLLKNKSDINRITCEVADNYYSKKFGDNVSKFEVLHISEKAENVTIVGDLSDLTILPHESIDCFILTQTLNFIYDFKKAITGVHHMLKPEGVVLATVSGISQISKYDMDRWGDYWRFTELSIKKSFVEVFGKENVTIDVYGNVLTAVSFLEGISSEELSEGELNFKDGDYQLIIGVRANK